MFRKMDFGGRGGRKLEEASPEAVTGDNHLVTLMQHGRTQGAVWTRIL